MAPSNVVDEGDHSDDQYHESSDEDFDPATAPPEHISSSEDDLAATTRSIPRKRKRKAPDDEELDSGDEATIQAARKKWLNRGNKKGSHQDGGDDEDELLLSEDEGGEGGLIKTRAQRRGEQKERRPLARIDGATVDVDVLWARMIAAPLQPLQPSTPPQAIAAKDEEPASPIEPTALRDEEQITIQKTYTFAGQDTTEEKSIPRSHLPTFLSDGWNTLDPNQVIAKQPTNPSPSSKPTTTTTTTSPVICRPLRRPTRFDPNPTGYVRALAPEHQLLWPRQPPASPSHHPETAPTAPPDAPVAKAQKPQKLNVVDKSRMDWTGFVHKEGIAEELDTHGKTKEAYLGRMEFLAGVEARREEERLKGKSNGKLGLGTLV